MSTNPNLFPAAGVTKLSFEERQAMALQKCDTNTHVLACESEIHVGIFFDGTGNNMKLDFELPKANDRKHTNVVKLFQTYPFKPEKGFISTYIPGVGTPFDEIGDTNKPDMKGTNWGSIGASYGEHRILWALIQVLNAPHQYVKGKDSKLIPDAQAKDLVDQLQHQVNTARNGKLKTLQADLTKALNGLKPNITRINLSVFGFSRGAAQARTFVNWLFEACDKKGNDYLFAKIPLRVQFMGIFDTVASVGLANLNDSGTLAGHQSWADNSLQIHPAVGKCIHYVAGHELRACFPLDSVRIKGSYPANCQEVVYPGSHSDVGGGYPPGALGVASQQQDSLAVIAGQAMYYEALKARNDAHYKLAA
jgi:hypothetical protein